MKLGDFLGKHEKDQVGFREFFSIIVITIKLEGNGHEYRVRI